LTYVNTIEISKNVIAVLTLQSAISELCGLKRKHNYSRVVKSSNQKCIVNHFFKMRSGWNWQLHYQLTTFSITVFLSFIMEVGKILSLFIFIV